MANYSTSETSSGPQAAISITNGVLGLMLVGMLGAFLYFEFAYEPEVEAADVEPYVQEVQQRLEQHADEISTEAASLASDTLPPLSDAFYEQTKDDYALYLQTLQNQGDTYLDNTQDMLVAKVQSQYKDYLRAHANVLKEEFPEHASDENVEQVLAEFEHTIDRIAARYYIDEFRAEAERTKVLWQRFEPVPQPGPNEPSLGEQLADYTADWTIIALADEGESQTAAAAPAEVAPGNVAPIDDASEEITPPATEAAPDESEALVPPETPVGS